MNERTEEVRWLRARGCASGNCLEVAKVGDHILVRDSKRPEVVIPVSAGDWQAFAAGVKAGDFSF